MRKWIEVNSRCAMCSGIQCDSCPHEYMGNYELANGCIWQYKEQVLNLIGEEKRQQS